MQNMTIGRRLALGFGIITGVVMVLGGFTYWELRHIRAASDRVSIDALPGTTTSGALAVRVKQAYVDALEHIASNDPKAMSEAEAQILRERPINAKLFEEYEKSITTAEDRANFEKVLPLRQQFLERLDATLALSRAGKKEQALAMAREQLQPAYDAYDSAMMVLFNWSSDYGRKAGEEIDAVVSSTIAGLLAGVLLAIVVAIVIAGLIIRNTSSVLHASVSTLKDGAQQVSSASTQVASAAHSLSQGASEQAASIEETSASMEEMASMSRQNAENSRSAEALIRTVDARVTDSNAALDAMVQSMAAIKGSSDNISRIIKTIDEIAFQTNILALNAAVEAARAGEAGMGFAVVADEVRSLAQRSAQAAKNTTDLIEQSIERSNEGAQRVEQMAGSIRSITDAVGEVRRLVEAVSTASQQQAQGFDQVSQAIAQMEKVTQTNAATAEESAAASEELNAQAEASLVAVTEIATLVGDTAASKVEAAAARRKGNVSAFSARKRAA